MHQGTFFRPRQSVLLQQDQRAPLPVVRAFHLPDLVAVKPDGIGAFQRQIRRPAFRGISQFRRQIRIHAVLDAAGQDDDVHGIRNLRVHHLHEPVRDLVGEWVFASGAVGPEQDRPRRGFLPGIRRAGAAEEGNGQQDRRHGEKNECSFFHVSQFPP